MKFAVKSHKSGKLYGPMPTTDHALRWARQNIDQAWEIIPLHAFTIERRKPRRRKVTKP